MATMADYLSVSLPDDAAEDSVSNLPLWKNPDQGSVREDTVHQSIDGSLSIRKGKWKLELCPGSGGWSRPKPGEEGLDAPRFQFYDLDSDISERNNVIYQNFEVEESLKDRLKEIINQGRSTPGAPQTNDGADIS